MFDEVVNNKDAAAAEHKLLGVSGLRKFVERLKSPREVEDFKRHLRKYVNMWLPDCPFEVSTTNRYTIVTQEAAIRARRDIKKGETIRYLCGNLVSMTEEEEKDLDLTRRDFSIVMSSRKKTPSLFLGPARFANHDCDANARLTTTGSDGMQIFAIKYIRRDEEITVTYGEDYFGTNNCECLCGTCEGDGKAGWTANAIPTSRTQTPVSTKEDPVEPYGFRRKRKYITSLASGSNTPDPETFRPAKRGRSSTVEPSSPGLRKRTKGANRRSALSRFSPETNSGKAVMSSPTPAAHPSPAPVIAFPEAKLKSSLGAPETDSSKNIDIPLSVAHEVCSDTKASYEYMIKNLDEVPPQGAEPKTPTRAMRSSQMSNESTDVDSVFESDEVDLITTGTPSSVNSDRQAPKASLIKVEDGVSLASSPLLQVPAYGTSMSVEEDAPLLALASTTEPNVASTSMSLVSETELSAKSRLCRLSASIATSVEEVSEDAHVQKVPSIELSDAKVKEETLESARLSPVQDIDSDSELSCLASDEEFDDENFCIKPKRKAQKARKKKLAPPISVQVEPEIPKVRYPNDYTNTPLLLAEPESKWVQCKTCSNVWVQQNAYYTRRECPRCERHSKLYGYRWPKTEQLKGDPERIKDHREIHRFLDPEEELELREKERVLCRASETPA